MGAGRVEKCLGSSMNLAWIDFCITSAPSPGPGQSVGLMETYLTSKEISYDRNANLKMQERQLIPAIPELVRPRQLD